MERTSVTEQPTAAEPAEPVKPIDHALPAEPKRAPSVPENAMEPAMTLPPATEPEEPMAVTEDTSVPAKPAVDEETSIGMLLCVVYVFIHVADMFIFRCCRETRCLVEDSERSRFQTTWRTAFLSETGSRGTGRAATDQQWP